MHTAFKAFMWGLIDYAGLFPPAKLPLDQAFNNYVSYQHEPDAWVLAKFICPVMLLKDLIPYKVVIQENSLDISLTVLPSGIEMRSTFLECFPEDLQEINQFLQKMDQGITVDALEFRIFPELLNHNTQPALHLFLNEISETLESAGFSNVQLFFELNQSEGWIDKMKQFTEEIALFNQDLVKTEKSSRSVTAGLKLRCGGEKPENVPSPEEVAQTIHSCVIAGIPFKATAGLHHPVRHYDTSLKTTVHGFLNIFGSALLAYHHRLTQVEIQSIIMEEDPAQFIFDGHLFQYQQWSIDSDQMNILRKELVISFGSCSFDEPREDLIQLGLLDD